jgi:trimeric autotransporter adhesin
MKKQLFIIVFSLSFSHFTVISAQNISTVVGNTISGGPFGGGYSGDAGPATAAELQGPYDVAFDHSSTMYIADKNNQVIRQVDYFTGNIGTFAGNYTFGAGYSGDGGVAFAAELHNPTDIAVDDSGNVYIADTYNNVIRKVETPTATIITIAGNYSYGPGFSGDGGPASVAELNNPAGLTLDASGNLFISDENNNVIRKVDHLTSNITTVAGNYSDGAGYNGDDIPATSAKLNNPTGVSVDASGDIFIADLNNQLIREVDSSSGIISSVAGNHVGGYNGDGGTATNAELDYPVDVKVDVLGNLFISDQFNLVIREVDHTSGNINTIAGNYADGAGYSGDGGPATAAQLNEPAGIALDNKGNLYIADAGNNVIRKVNSVTVGISKITSSAVEMSVYPNPSNGIFNIQWSVVSGQHGSYQAPVMVYNVFGEKVFETLLPQAPKGALSEVNLSSLSDGVYFLQITTQQGNICKQIVIEK